VSQVFVAGIDGGNSKTEVMIVDDLGTPRGHARGPGSSTHALGLDGTVAVLDGLIAQARADAALPGDTLFAHLALCVAGVDLPDEEAALLEAAESAGWARAVSVRNDTFALLRASGHSWGVAMVLGAGTNCVGLDRDGRVEGYLSLGENTGDWGGGDGIGRFALHHASRAQDGRGPATVLAVTVPRHFGMDTPLDVAIAIHRGEISESRFVELPPLVFAAATEGDDVARSLITHQADEVVATTTAVIRRLGLEHSDVPVVLGGGLLAANLPLLLDPIVAGIRAVAPAAEVGVVTSPPVIGATLLALDAVGASSAAIDRLLAGRP
jgi:N-acetylglucosamine kinase-like BadF-type ATPase